MNTGYGPLCIIEIINFFDNDNGDDEILIWYIKLNMAREANNLTKINLKFYFGLD